MRTFSVNTVPFVFIYYKSALYKYDVRVSHVIILSEEINKSNDLLISDL